MKNVKGDLKEVTSEAKELQSEAKEMESEVKSMDSEVKEMADETRALARLQAALKLHDKAMAETFFQDCLKGKPKFASNGTCAFCLLAAYYPCITVHISIISAPF